MLNTRTKRGGCWLGPRRRREAAGVWAVVLLVSLTGCGRESDPNRPERIAWKAGQSPVRVAPGHHVVIHSVSPTTGDQVRLDDYGHKAFWFALSSHPDTGRVRLQDALPAYDRLNDTGQVFTVDIRWSADGTRSMLLVNGRAEAMFDFENEFGMHRGNLPDADGFPWSSRGQPWNDALLFDVEGLPGGPHE